jgi:hypothetical protein
MCMYLVEKYIFSSIIENVVFKANKHKAELGENRSECGNLGFRRLESEGPVAQWITRLTTDQKNAGSNPARIVFSSLVHFHVRRLNFFSVGKIASTNLFYNCRF